MLDFINNNFFKYTRARQKILSRTIFEYLAKYNSSVTAVQTEVIADTKFQILILHLEECIIQESYNNTYQHLCQNSCSSNFVEIFMFAKKNSQHSMLSHTMKTSFHSKFRLRMIAKNYVIIMVIFLSLNYYIISGSNGQH